MIKQATIALLYSASVLTAPIHFEFKEPMYFATTADEEHYPWLLILLNTIKEYHPKKEFTVLIFDLGLSQHQINELNQDERLKVYPIEMVHPHITKKFVVRSNGRLARGWYAWKPVALKQAFDHVPYFLYVDAGKRLTGPADDIFHAIVEHGYFLMDCGHTIDPMTTKKVREKFNLENSSQRWILNRFGVEAGIQGLSKKVFKEYVEPMYELAHDIEWFADDGTAPWGFGGARHDQTLFSIVAQKNRYTIIKVCGDGPDHFMVKGKKIPFNRNHYFQYKNMEDNPKATENHLI